MISYKRLFIVVSGIFFMSGIFSYSYAADCQPLGSVAENIGSVKWVHPTEREDGTALPLSEIKGYTLYKTDKLTNVTCDIQIVGTSVTQHQVEMLPDNPYDFMMTTIDTGDRVSADSDILRVQYPVIQPPAAVSDLVITKISDLVYGFAFSPVTTYADGTALPADAVEVYYLFEVFGDGTSKWLQNIAVGNEAITQRPVTAGIHNYSMETQISVDGSSSVVSARSPTMQIDTNDGTVVVLPPVKLLFEVIVPSGHRPVITIVPN